MVMPSQLVISDSERIFRRILGDVFSDFHGTRLQLAELLSARADRGISRSMLDAYSSPASETARFPAALILPLAEITGDDRLQRFVMGPRLRQLVEFAERELWGLRDAREREALRETLLANLGDKPIQAKDGGR